MKTLVVFFSQNVEPDDLEILQPAGSECAGLARLRRACTGQADPAAPNSTPVFSKSGAKIGFIADGPVPVLANSTYLLAEGGC